MPGHGIDHKEGFDGLDGLMQRLNFRHHLGIDGQTTGRVQNQHIGKLLVGFLQRSLCDVHGLFVCAGGNKARANLASQRFQLGYRRWPVNVCTDDGDFFLFTLFKQPRELGHSRGFTRTL